MVLTLCCERQKRTLSDAAVTQQGPFCFPACSLLWSRIDSAFIESQSGHTRFGQMRPVSHGRITTLAQFPDVPGLLGT